MTLELPSDLVEHVGRFGDCHAPGVYALELERPEDVHAAWRREFDAVPEWFTDFRDAEAVVYVGAAQDLLKRLSEHAHGERETVLTRVCDVAGIVDVWVFEDADRAFQEESRLAIQVRQERGDVFVRQA
jgi:predicted GIY-YIG superfamily endonuclease